MNILIPYIILILFFIITAIALMVVLGTMIGTLQGNAPLRKISAYG